MKKHIDEVRKRIVELEFDGKAYSFNEWKRLKEAYKEHKEGCYQMLLDELKEATKGLEAVGVLCLRYNKTIEDASFVEVPE